MATGGKEVLMQRTAVFIALLLLLAAAACGGGGGSTAQAPTGTEAASTSPSSSAAQAVAEAGVKTRAAESARIAFTGTISGGAANGTFSGEGEFSGRQGRMTMDMSGLAGGQIAGRMEMIFDELVFYMKFPEEIAQGMPGDKNWIKFDLSQLGEQEGIDFQQLMQLSGTDPSQSLDLLLAASDDFHEVGEDEIRGVPTTQYAGTIDLEKVADQAPPEARETYQRLLEVSEQTKVPVEVWIDEDGLTRRIRYEQTMPDRSTMNLTQEYYDFGVEVDVSPPPDDEVLDVTDLMGGR
jgi:LppX_LprAFG lipoprotein